MPRLRFVSTVEGVHTIELTEPIITIGRTANNVVCIEDPNISKHHTLLINEDNTYKIYDLHSVNGTWINGDRITAGTLKEGDAVRIGYLELKYEIAVPVIAPRAPQPAPAAPTPIALKPKMGFKAAPAPAATTSEPPTVVAPVKEEKRGVIRLPEEKKTTAPAPLPPPAPAAAPEPTPAPAPAAEEPTEPPKPKLKPFARETPPPASPEAGSGDAPAGAPGFKKFASTPGGPPKLKLKRE